jgi:hypothetical protein
MKRALYKRSLTRKAKRHDVLNKNAQKWVDALLLGKYKQTTGVLCGKIDSKNTLGFCCLGVACEVAAANGVKIEIEDDLAFDNETVVGRTYSGKSVSLPSKVCKWIGLADDMGGYYNVGLADKIGFACGGSLAEDNDRGCNFKRIAKIISAKPKGLFRKGY